MESQSNLVPHSGDIYMRAFTSFVTNHMHWWDSSQAIDRNGGKSTLSICGEPQAPIPLIVRYKKYLSSPEKVNKLVASHQKVISTCVSLISQQEDYALKGSNH